jgi:hypothetical protein
LERINYSIVNPNTLNDPSLFERVGTGKTHAEAYDCKSERILELDKSVQERV